MGQQEVIDTLKENGDWMSRVDIAKVTGLMTGSIGASANKLLKFKEIQLRVTSKRVPQKDRRKKIQAYVHEYKLL